jgi:hypothetical protein
MEGKTSETEWTNKMRHWAPTERGESDRRRRGTEIDVQEPMDTRDLDVKFSRIDWNEANATNIGMYHIHRSYLICLYTFHGLISKYIIKSLLNYVGFDQQFFFLHRWPDFDQVSYG